MFGLLGGTFPACSNQHTVHQRPVGLAASEVSAYLHRRQSKRQISVDFVGNYCPLLRASHRRRPQLEEIWASPWRNHCCSF